MDLFKIFGTISLKGKEEAEQGLKDVSGEGEKTSSKLGNFFGAIGKGAVAVGKTIASGIAVGSVAIAKIGKDAIEQYGDYEQLVGGVETLFKDSSDKVLEYANNAYKTAGLSANEYMETVTSFSASLLQSLDGDTVKASEVANQAIVDMSDNANKMGTSMESIQNAYQGFAKQNYTMLDNLKLGYGGTKEEMARLLADAQELSGIEYDISSFADITEAIHVIQTEMGITGTTAKEASTTIQGSIGSMKSAWANFMTGLSDPDQDLGVLITNVVDTASTAIGNIVPRIVELLPRISESMKMIVDSVIPLISELLKTLLPTLIQGAVDLINGLVEALPTIIDALLDSLPLLIDGILQIFEGIIKALPQIIESLCSALPELIPQLVTGITNGFVILLQYLPQMIQPIIDNLPLIIDSIINALIENLPILIDAIIECAIAVGKQLWTITEQIFGQIWNILVDVLTPVAEWIDENVVAPAMDLWENIKSIFATVSTWVYDNIIEPVVKFVTDMWNSIVSTFHMVIDPWIEIVKRASTLIYDEVIEPVEKFFVDLWDKISKGASDAWEGIKKPFSSIADWFGDIFQKAWQKVKDVFSKGGEIFSGIKDGIVKAFANVVNTIIDGINKIIPLPFNAINSVLTKLKDIKILGVKPFDWVKTISVPEIPKVEWYAKAMEDGMIMNKPTVFGYNPDTGKAMAGGEAGSETVVGTNSLMQMIVDAVKTSIKEMNIDLYLDGDKLVGGTAQRMNEKLGQLAVIRRRGVTV